MENITERPWDLAINPIATRPSEIKPPLFSLEQEIRDWICEVEFEICRPHKSVRDINILKKHIASLCDDAKPEFLKRCLDFLRTKKKSIDEMRGIKMEEKEAIILEVLESRSFT